MGTVTGIFNSINEAKNAFSELQTQAGFCPEELSSVDTANLDKRTRCGADGGR